MPISAPSAEAVRKMSDDIGLSVTAGEAAEYAALIAASCRPMTPSPPSWPATRNLKRRARRLSRSGPIIPTTLGL